MNDEHPQPTLALPPWLNREDGAIRRIGVEIEMSGLGLDVLADLVCRHLDLEVRSPGRYERHLRGDPAGDWLVELDFNLLKTMGREARDPDAVLDDVMNTAEDWLHRAAQHVVPLELVSPPLPMDRLDEVETLIALLRVAGAKGSSDNLVNAFGLQLNPEVPDTRTETLTAYLKAFLCLSDWLVQRADVDMTRRLTTYIDPFPREYIHLVVNPGYRPDRDRLMGDYLMANPTRNRALDWLPLFAHMDAARVKATVDDPLIKARPALHYRLPNCEIHRPEWGLRPVWQDWLVVERLAADTDRLNRCCAAYTRFLNQDNVARWLGNWVRELEAEWIDL